MTTQDKIRPITKTKDCYKRINSVPIDRNPKQIWVGRLMTINRLAFQVARKCDQNKDEVVEIVALGESILKSVRLVEFLRKTVADLHISVDVISLKFKDTYKPLYQGLSEVTAESQRAAMLVRISFNPKGIVGTPGHQAAVAKVDKERSDQFLAKARDFNPKKARTNQVDNKNPRSKSQRQPRRDKNEGEKTDTQKTEGDKKKSQKPRRNNRNNKKDQNKERPPKTDQVKKD